MSFVIRTVFHREYNTKCSLCVTILLKIKPINVRLFSNRYYLMNICVRHWAIHYFIWSLPYLDELCPVNIHVGLVRDQRPGSHSREGRSPAVSVEGKNKVGGALQVPKCCVSFISGCLQTDLRGRNEMTHILQKKKKQIKQSKNYS